MIKHFKLIIFFLAFASAWVSSPAHANYGPHRFGLGVGVARIEDNTYLEMGAEYEYRFHEMLGAGGFLNYVFSTPSIELVGFPELFFHPLGGDWYINAAPIAQFGKYGTHYGARLGTRIPIELGPVNIIPQVSVDFIRGKQNLLFGLGVSI